jgi:hypothetical protein
VVVSLAIDVSNAFASFWMTCKFAPRRRLAAAHFGVAAVQPRAAGNPSARDIKWAVEVSRTVVWAVMVWSLFGCGGMVALSVVVVIVIAVMVNQLAKRQAESLAEADKLYQAGKTDEAAAKYKDAYAAAGDRKADVVKRIVDVEAGKGNTAEAKKWVERGLSDKLVLSFDSPAGRSMLADVQRDRDTKVAQQRVEDDARAKQQATERDDRDQVRKNRNLPREEFRALLKGKTKDEVIRLIGRPDEIADIEGLGGQAYNYANVAPDPVSKKRSLASVSFDKAGVVESVNFI